MYNEKNFNFNFVRRNGVWLCSSFVRLRQHLKNRKLIIEQLGSANNRKS